MIVAAADDDDTQFPTYELLKCDYTFQFMISNVRMEIAGVTRSQNSYNSGVWLDYKVQSPEDQSKFIVPLNRETEKIYDDLRMIVDARVITEPKVWTVTKVNRIAPNGLVHVTLSQDRFDPNHDFVEKDEDGNVIGMWADYYIRGIEPSATSKPVGNIYSAISYSGTQNSQLRIKANPKKFTVTFYDTDGETDYRDGSWSYAIDGKDAADLA